MIPRRPLYRHNGQRRKITYACEKTHSQKVPLQEHPQTNFNLKKYTVTRMIRFKIVCKNQNAFNTYVILHSQSRNATDLQQTSPEYNQVHRLRLTDLIILKIFICMYLDIVVNYYVLTAGDRFCP